MSMHRLLFLVFFFITASHSIHGQTVDHQNNEAENVTRDQLLNLLPNDRFLGNMQAPVLIIEYAALTCYHCSLFHKDVLPEIKRNYIDTGKVLYIFRHFPIDYRGLKAAMLSYCYKSQEDHFNFNKAVFDAIESWNYSNSSDLTLLHRIAKLSNLKESAFNQCINDEQILNALITAKSLATSKLNITVTPIFFIRQNNEESSEYKDCSHEGYKKFDYFAEVIDAVYKKATGN